MIIFITVPWLPLVPPRDRERGTRKVEERRPVDAGDEPVGTSEEENSSRAQIPGERGGLCNE